MSALSAEEFYSDVDEAPQQGDLLLGAVSRVVGADEYAPARWAALDEHTCALAPAGEAGHLVVPELRVAAGRALVMVTSHDCGLDKEFNALVDTLADPAAPDPVEEAVAMARAEARADLDRSFTVSPLVHPASVEVAGTAVDRGLLMSGRVVGYLPVPALVVQGRTVIAESVVDLGYRAALDRLAYTQRISCVSERTRRRLRYALAKLDVLRTPSLEFDLSRAIGQRIVAATVTRKNTLVVLLTLEDGSTVELLVKPGSPAAGPVSRSRRSLP